MSSLRECKLAESVAGHDESQWRKAAETWRAYRGDQGYAESNAAACDLIADGIHKGDIFRASLRRTVPILTERAVLEAMAGKIRVCRMCEGEELDPCDPGRICPCCMGQGEVLDATGFIPDIRYLVQ